MSQDGINKAAEVFTFMGGTRNELISMGAKNHDQQDILLGQMLEDGKEAMTEKFCKLTLMKDKKK